jgi:hypothetical protein
MLVFPQLLTGAPALYPVTKRALLRTVVNVLGDGHTDVSADADAAATAWELRATGLTGTEWNAIEGLFQATSGMWQTFTFLDPTGNLLAQSESFGASAWTNGALIQLTGGIGDPFGTTRATRAINAGQTAQAVTQILSAPGNFQYCLSVWARAAGGSSVTLMQSTTGGSVSKRFALGAVWTRVFVAGSCGQNTTSITFGAQLDAGASVDLFGMQAEAQPAPSDYRMTGATGGLYARARFGEDRLTVTAQGTDVYDATIRIVNMGN